MRLKALSVLLFLTSCGGTTIPGSAGAPGGDLGGGAANANGERTTALRLGNVVIGDNYFGGNNVPVAQFPRQGDTPSACSGASPVGTCAFVVCSGFAQQASCQDESSVSAGTIHASTRGANESIELSPTGVYGGGFFPFSLNSGDDVTFETRGGPDVPAFQVMVTMPPPSRLVSAGASSADAALFTIDTARDLPLEWERIPSGDVVFVIYGVYDAGGPPCSDPTARLPQLICTFDGASGAGTVPQADLAAVARTARPAGFFQWQASFQTFTRSSTIAGHWNVEALAYNSPLGSSPGAGPWALRLR